jgi:hypothetical protein
MSKVSLAGNASGTGIFTIASPNSNTDRTLTLPDNTGTVALQGGVGVGKILQVVSATVTGDTGTTSTSYGSTGLYATITPSSTSSRIICLASSNCSNVSNSGNALCLSFYRGTSGNGSGSLIGANPYYWVTYNSTSYQAMQMMYLDSPASTAALTYTVMHKSGTAGQNVGWCYGFGSDNRASLILMEVGA